MNMGFNRAIAPAFVLIFLFFSSAHADEKWKSGFGQGISEAFVDHGPGNRIYVACESGFGRPVTSVTFSLGDENPRPSSVVTVIFDHGDPQDVPIDEKGQVGSNCRACATWFEYLLDGFKNRQSVFVRFENGLSATFSLNGASDAIGECTPDIFKTYDN